MEKRKRGRPRKQLTNAVIGTKAASVNKKHTSVVVENSGVSDGSTAKYYELPARAKELQDLISYKDMNAQIGEIFRSCYRYGQSSHSDQLRDAKKIKFYIDAEIKRLGG